MKYILFFLLSCITLNTNAQNSNKWVLNLTVNPVNITPIDILSLQFDLTNFSNESVYFYDIASKNYGAKLEFFDVKTAKWSVLTSDENFSPCGKMIPLLISSSEKIIFSSKPVLLLDKYSETQDMNLLALGYKTIRLRAFCYPDSIKQKIYSNEVVIKILDRPISQKDLRAYRWLMKQTKPYLLSLQYYSTFGVNEYNYQDLRKISLEVLKRFPKTKYAELSKIAICQTLFYEISAERSVADAKIMAIKNYANQLNIAKKERTAKKTIETFNDDDIINVLLNRLNGKLAYYENIINNNK